MIVLDDLRYCLLLLPCVGDAVDSQDRGVPYIEYGVLGRVCGAVDNLSHSYRGVSCAWESTQLFVWYT